MIQTHLQTNKKINISKRNKLPQDGEERIGLVEKINEQIQRLNGREVAPSTQTAERVRVLQERIKLITSIREYDDVRLKNLQKILKHYSTNVFKSGHKYNFDQISYINHHMIIQRFFAFLADFKLNQIHVNAEKKQIVQPKDIVLLFKKCSSNSKNLDLAQFITCLERLFVMLFDQHQNYAKKQERINRQKRQKRKEAKQREKDKREKINAKLAVGSILKHAVIPKSKSPPKQPKPNIKQNANLGKQLMHNTQIISPIEQADKSVQGISINLQAQPLYCLTDQQKIESYMLNIGIDDRKQIQKKLRSFQRGDYHYTEVEQLQKFKPQKDNEKSRISAQSVPFKQLISMHHQWNRQKSQKQKHNVDRFTDVKLKIDQRQAQKSKIHLSRSLSKEEYDSKRKKMSEVYSFRQKSLLDPYALKRIAKRGDEIAQDSQFYSLQMLHRSSPNQLQIHKIMPDRYISSDPTDHIFLDQYGFIQPNQRKVSVGSNAQLIESTKRRAFEVQTQQTKRLNRLATNLHQNQDYLEKMLSRKW